MYKTTPLAELLVPPTDAEWLCVRSSHLPLSL